MKRRALVDSNVIIAALAEAHEHHGASFRVLQGSEPGALAIAAHSYAEAYGVLTRRSERSSFGFTPEEAWNALEAVKAATTLVGLTSNQTIDAIRDYARAGGVGARLYDKLIGEAAVIHAIPMIVTWNISHMQGLFPRLEIVTPAVFSIAE